MTLISEKNCPNFIRQFFHPSYFSVRYSASISVTVKPVFSEITLTEIPAFLKFFAISRCFSAAPSSFPFLSPRSYSIIISSSKVIIRSTSSSLLVVSIQVSCFSFIEVRRLSEIFSRMRSYQCRTEPALHHTRLPAFLRRHGNNGCRS